MSLVRGESSYLDLLTRVLDQPTENAQGIMSHNWTPEPVRIQQVLNQDAPPTRALQLMPDKGRIPVRGRLVWDTDGEEWVDAYATRWTRTQVFVQPGDARLAGAIGVWISARDVERR